MLTWIGLAVWAWMTPNNTEAPIGVGQFVLGVGAIVVFCFWLDRVDKDKS